ncbi:cell division protein ZapA [Halanaerobaculum tunisiense]
MDDSDNKSEAKVEILGEEYIIKGDKSADYIIDLASFLDNHLQKVKEKNSSNSRGKIMILGAMNLADKLYTAQSDYQTLENKYQQLQEDYQEIKAKYQQSGTEEES